MVFNRIQQFQHHYCTSMQQYPITVTRLVLVVQGPMVASNGRSGTDGVNSGLPHHHFGTPITATGGGGGGGNYNTDLGRNNQEPQAILDHLV